MSVYRPLSVRDRPDPKFDELHEGVPPWLRQHLVCWVADRLGDCGYDHRIPYIKNLELDLRPNTSILDDFDKGSLLTHMRLHDEFALDVIDYILETLDEKEGHPAGPVTPQDVRELNTILQRGGSAWEAVPDEPHGRWMLSRRALGPARDALQAIAPLSDRAHDHLQLAWRKLMRRDPDPSASYDEAVRAVEAALCPVVIPDDPVPTLGKVIPAIRDKPEKWTFELGEPIDVADVAEILWTNQQRHAVPEGTPAKKISQGEADAALHLAITLVRWGAGGLFRQTENVAAA